MPCAIILAAGSSTRLGQPKQTVRIAGETLLERSIRTATQAGLYPIFVVIAPEIACNPVSDITLLVNHAASQGMASSIRIGIQAAKQATAQGAVILACDQIAVTPEHLRALTQLKSEIRASRYAGRNGIPAYFPESWFKDLLRLTGDIGARDLLRDATALPLLNGDLDIDTPDDLARARLLFPEMAGS